MKARRPQQVRSKFRTNCWGHDRSLIPQTSEESQKNRDSFVIPGLRFAKRANLRGAEATNKRSPRKKKPMMKFLAREVVVFVFGRREPRFALASAIFRRSSLVDHANELEGGWRRGSKSV